MARLQETPMHARVRAEHLGVLLRDRYPAEEYAVLYEVRDGTGFHASRSADAIVFSLWPSRGLEVSGFEFKVSRTDWIKELRNPAKAEAIASYCDRWWLVVSNADILRAGELPPKWGLMEVQFRGEKQFLHVVQPAEKLEPIALDRLFVAAICRAAQASSPGEHAMRVALDRAKADWDKRHKDSVDAHLRQKINELAAVKNAVAKFEQVSGLRIDRYDGDNLAHAVNLLREKRGFVVHPDIRSAIDTLKQFVSHLEEIENLPAVKVPLRIETTETSIG